MKKVLALLLCMSMLFTCAACGQTEAPAEPAAEPVAEAPAEPETPAEPEAPAEPEVVHIDRNEGMLPFGDCNLFKLSTAEEFAAGEMDGLEAAEVGNGAVRLADGVLEGTFVSPEFCCDTFTKMVACWNASIEEGASVEIWGRARRQGPDTEEVDWTDWLTWGDFTPYASRGTSQNKSGRGAYVDQDTFTSTSGYFDGFQMKAVVKRDSADVESPVLRQISMTFKGGDMPVAYAEETVDLPLQALCASPAYSQETRYASIADSICSPTTMTVILNTIDPELDLLPEEYALSSKDNGEDIFGSWSFCCAFAGCYGYECYCQYADKDIIMQELAKGHPVGLSVAYTTKNLPGAWGNTGGHLITLIGYEYEGGTADDDHLYFFSSDSYSREDCESYRRYKWTDLENLDCSFVAYIVPSAEREEECVGVKRLSAKLEKGSGTKAEWVLVCEDGAVVDLSGFRSGKGALCYTIEGVGTDMTADTRESDWSIVYPEAVNAAANNKFFYIMPEADFSFAFDKAAALRVAENDDAQITFYAITNHGVMYIAEIE